MGRAKQQQIQDGERGVDSSETGYYVCQNCFDNPGLRKFIAENALEQVDPEDIIPCDFCDPADASYVVADFDQVCEYMVSCIRHRFNDPASELPYETAEGGYQGNVLHTYDVLIEIAGLDTPNDSDNKLLYAINRAVSDEYWCKRDYFGLSSDEAMQVSWEEFQEVSKEGTVLDFMYGRVRDDRESRSPAEFLDWLGEQCVDYGLIKTIPGGSKVFRVRRQWPDRSFRSASDLGPPPPDIAKANRLSPAGTVMTYTAESLETALFETANEDGTYAVGEFVLLRDIHVLDLVDLPEPVCFFDLDGAVARDVIGFLRSFATDVSRPLAPSAEVTVEYIPTQIVTQHFRRRVLAHGELLDGIRYGSAKHKGGICLGLFADSFVVCEPDSRHQRIGIRIPPPWIMLEAASEVVWP